MSDELPQPYIRDAATSKVMLSELIRIWCSKTELIPTAELRARHTTTPPLSEIRMIL